MVRVVFISEVVEISAGSMLIRTVLMGSEGDGAVSRHDDLVRVPQFGDWEIRSKELHDRLSKAVLSHVGRQLTKKDGD
jgi:hypothetical protein